MPQRSRRILVIDDSEAARKPLVDLLCSAGFAVDQADTDAESLRGTEARPALIVLDRPLLDPVGREIGRRLRADPATATIPLLQPSSPPVPSEDGGGGSADAYFSLPINPVELLATVRSLLRLRAAEESARYAAQQWQSTFDAISDAICLVDRDGRILRHNRAMAALAGQPEGAVNGRLYADVLRSDLGDNDLPATQRVRESGNRVTRDTRARDRWLRILTDPVFDADGAIVGTVHILSDITERRASAIRQKAFLRDLLANVTEGKLTLVDHTEKLPPPLPRIGEAIELMPGSLGALRRRVREVSSAVGLAPERWQDLETATGEAAMNAVVHGGGGRAYVGSDGRKTVQVWVDDLGPGIAMDYLHRATLERGYTTSGTMGHGFWMMLQTVDRIWLLTGAGGTTVVLEQDREKHEPTWLNRF